MNSPVSLVKFPHRFPSVRLFSAAVVVTIVLLVANASVSHSIATAQSVVDGFCDRTPQIRDAILAKISGVDDCAAVTVEQLATVKLLTLNRRGISEIKQGDFNGLTRLANLQITYNDFTELPAGIFDELTALTAVYLIGNGLINLPPRLFANSPRIIILYLSDNELESLPDDLFDPLANLLILDLENNELQALPPSFVQSPPGSLSQFTIGDNNFGQLPSGLLDNLPTSIISLDLNGIPITDEDLTLIRTRFPTLQEIHLSNTGIDGALLTSFLAGVNPGLFTLDISQNELGDWLEGASDMDVAALITALRRFQLSWLKIGDPTLNAMHLEIILGALNAVVFSTLNLDGAMLNGINGEWLTKFTRLRSLSLAGTGLNDEDVDSIVDYAPTSITTLNLAGNDLTKAPENGFGRLSKLKNLYLHGNNIEMLSVDSFRGLTGLAALWLQNNRMTSIDPDVFDGLNGLRQLALFNNPLTHPLTREDFPHLPAYALYLPAFSGSNPTVYRVEPVITAVTLRAGEKVRLGVDVYGIQNILDNGLVDDVDAEQARFTWSDGGRAGSFSEFTTSETRQNSEPDDRQVVYEAPDSPGVYTVSANIPFNVGCYGPEEGEDDADAVARCTAEFEITVRRSSPAIDRNACAYQPLRPHPLDPHRLQRLRVLGLHSRRGRRVRRRRIRNIGRCRSRT